MEIIKPLAFIDLETTGVKTHADRIIEVAVLKIHPDGSRERFQSLVNPGMVLDQKIEELTGIKTADIIDAPPFMQVAPKLLEFIAGCWLCGFGVEFFDAPMPEEEFSRAGFPWEISVDQILDTCNIFKKKEPRNLTAAVKLYVGKELEGAHRAMVDAEASAEVFYGQLKMYSDMPRTMPELVKEFSNPGRVDLAGKLCRNEDGVICFAFGKHKDLPVADHFDYIHWMLKGAFPTGTKRILRQIVSDSFPKFPA